MSHDMVKLCKDAEQDMDDKSVETSFMVGDEEFLPVEERCGCRLNCSLCEI